MGGCRYVDCIPVASNVCSVVWEWKEPQFIWFQLLFRFTLVSAISQSILCPWGTPRNIVNIITRIHFYSFQSKPNFQACKTIKFFGILAILSILFIGGLVVSVKVGGGGDLHNMDAYMVILAISAVFICHHSLDITSEAHTGKPFFWPSVLLAAVVPITLLLGSVVPLPLDEEGGRNVLKIINAITSEVSDQGGRILFITQRHLLTFGNIQDVPVIPEYEILTLNEMAISGNEKYLSQFYQDLNDHKFDLIVADYQYGRPKQQRYSFGRENDLWTLNAGRYLTCEYIPFLTFQEYNIQLLIPRIVNPTCP